MRIEPAVNAFHSSDLTCARRRFMTATAAGGLAMVGCKPAPTGETKTTAKVRGDVPLRVLLCGGQRFSDVLQTAWSGVAAQPLAIRRVDPDSTPAELFQFELQAAMKTADVAIVPMGAMAAIDASSGLLPMTDAMLGQDGLREETLLPTIRESLMKFAGRTVAAPLGAIQPVLAIRRLAMQGNEDDSVTAPVNWDEYHALSKTFRESGSQVAEPLASGWAAKMFLWRANAANPPVWLFDRQTLAPVIDSQPYVETLATMQRCAEQYDQPFMTPGEVWSRLAKGELRMAITWPAPFSDNDQIDEIDDCEFFTMPRSAPPDSLTQTLVMTNAPVVILSSHCRQSEAATRFVGWLTGGEGTQMIQNAVAGLTLIRYPETLASGPTDDGGSGDDRVANEGTNSYDVVLTRMLSSVLIRTPLQLLDFRRYMASLDDAVLKCLRGEQTPQDALTATAIKWAALHLEVGEKKQAKAWRMAQGLSG